MYTARNSFLAFVIAVALGTGVANGQAPDNGVSELDVKPEQLQRSVLLSYPNSNFLFTHTEKPVVSFRRARET